MSDSGEAVPDPVQYRLRLFVAGNNPRSRRTIANLRRLCATHRMERVELEVIDIYQQPHLAAQDQIVAAPTLLKVFPPPMRRIIGDLSDEARVLRALELPLLPGHTDEL